MLLVTLEKNVLVFNMVGYIVIMGFEVGEKNKFPIYLILSLRDLADTDYLVTFPILRLLRQTWPKYQIDLVA